MTDTPIAAPKQSRNRRRRNWAIFFVLLFWVLLIYAITMIKIMGPANGG